jgi:hypothetical protein
MGIDYKIFGGFFFGTIGLFYIVRNAWIMAVFCAAWMWAGRWISKKDPDYIRIIISTMTEKKFYDAKMAGPQKVICE